MSVQKVINKTIRVTATVWFMGVGVILAAGALYLGIGTGFFGMPNKWDFLNTVCLLSGVAFVVLACINPVRNIKTSLATTAVIVTLVYGSNFQMDITPLMVASAIVLWGLYGLRKLLPLRFSHVR